VLGWVSATDSATAIYTAVPPRTTGAPVGCATTVRATTIGAMRVGRHADGYVHVGKMAP
jgi:hypothetical protein